jgi:mannose-6-phosphate isomerase-like protein (cupin superfamily)
VELGKVSPSIATLTALGEVLGCTAAELLVDHVMGTATPNGSSAPSQAAATHALLEATGVATVVQRAGTRPFVEPTEGVHWERLTPFSLAGMEFVHTIYEPGSESSPEGMYRRHSGVEWGYIISGTFHVSLGFEEYVLEPGDSISFSSNIHHRLHNPGPKRVHAIWSVLGGEGDVARESPLVSAVRHAGAHNGSRLSS